MGIMINIYFNLPCTLLKQVDGFYHGAYAVPSYSVIQLGTTKYYVQKFSGS